MSDGWTGNCTGTSQTPRQAQDGNQERVTLIGYVSATANRLPAFIIYAGKAHCTDWHKEGNGLDPDTVFAYTDNGWTKDIIGLEWLQNHFGKFAPPPH